MKKRAATRQKKLDILKKQYAQAKAQIQKVGFICRGSLTKRLIACGNPNCACHKDPKKRHGPYHQLSWKEKNKTVSRYIDPRDIPTYRQWLENRKKLMAIVEKMLAISREVGECQSEGKRGKGK